MTRRLFLLAVVAAAALYAEDFTGKVVAISDGDTIGSESDCATSPRTGCYPKN